MLQSNLIELTYYDPKSQVRLTAYADTIIWDSNGNEKILSAIRFGGYPEIVRGMADAIYGGAAIEAIQNGAAILLHSRLKGYERQFSHDGLYATATLMASDDAQTAGCCT